MLETVPRSISSFYIQTSVTKFSLSSPTVNLPINCVCFRSFPIMHLLPALTSLLFLAMFAHIDGQWFIIKKDYPSSLMNYPNPGRKRSISDAELNLLTIDCSQSYSQLRSYEEKAAWLLSCLPERSPLQDSLNSAGLDDDVQPTPPLIFHDRRTLRSSPPYTYEEDYSFNRRLLNRLRQVSRKK